MPHHLGRIEKSKNFVQFIIFTKCRAYAYYFRKMISKRYLENLHKVENESQRTNKIKMSRGLIFKLEIPCSMGCPSIPPTTDDQSTSYQPY